MSQREKAPKDEITTLTGILKVIAFHHNPDAINGSMLATLHRYLMATCKYLSRILSLWTWQHCCWDGTTLISLVGVYKDTKTCPRVNFSISFFFYRFFSAFWLIKNDYRLKILNDDINYQGMECLAYKRLKSV